MGGCHRFLLLVLVGLSGGIVPPASAATENTDTTPEQQEARLAKRIAGDLEAGRVTEAQADAAAGAQRFPTSPLLRRRLAQVHFSLALQKDDQLAQALDDARF